MSERDFLKDLLVTPPEQIEETMNSAHRAAVYDSNAPLSAEGERALLRAAANAGPVTLAEQPETASSQPELVQDVMGFVRRYPLQTAAAVAGAAYLLMRRRRR